MKTEYGDIEFYSGMIMNNAASGAVISVDRY